MPVQQTPEQEPSSSPEAATKQKKPPPNGEHRLRSENLAFDIDVWYPPLAQHTFASKFLPLKRSEADAIVAYYNAAWRSLPNDLTPDRVEILEALEARIDEGLKQFGHKGAFLRLCGRSPKDGEPTCPQKRARIWTHYQEVLQRKAKEEELPMDDENLRVAAIGQTESWLRCRTGADAVSLLVTSERVFSDMLDWLRYGEPEQIVLREFSDAFDLSTEFRCYIQHGVLQGISQYDTYARHAYLQDASQRAIVVRAVIAEWNKVKGCIETMDGSYCADFGVDLANERAQFIELSPFRTCTGPALFTWVKTTDKQQLGTPDRPDVHDTHLKEVLKGGDNEIADHAVFRVRSKPIPGIGGLVEMNWDLRWSEERVDTPLPYGRVYHNARVNHSAKPPPILHSLWNGIQQWWSASRSEEANQDNLLFVYGTLKQNCHWHSKYMTGAYFLGRATTAQPQPLVIGECGVPYLLDLNGEPNHNNEMAMPVRGELYQLSNEMLRGIDEYEGIDKGHYSRQEINIVVGGKTRCKAFCYFYAVKAGQSKVDASLLEAPRIAEYTAEEQKKCYKPIHHIQVKQLQYLGEEATT